MDPIGLKSIVRHGDSFVGQVAAIYVWGGVIKAVVENLRGGPPLVLPIVELDPLNVPAPEIKVITLSKGGNH